MKIIPCTIRVCMLLKAVKSSRDSFAIASVAAEPVSLVREMDIRGIPFDF